MLKYWNICVMLDYCDIGYTEKQVMKLEKLFNTFLKKYLIKIEPELIEADKEIVEILRKEKEFDESNEDAINMVPKEMWSLYPFSRVPHVTSQARDQYQGM